MASDLPDLRDLYGRCHAEPCQCRIVGPWRGRACSSWEPLGPSTQAELAEHYRGVRTYVDLKTKHGSVL